MSLRFEFVGASACLVLAMGCDGGDASDCGDACVEPTLSSIQQQVFGQSCAFSGCHNARSAAGGLDLSSLSSSFESLVGAATEAGDGIRVVPSRPEDSHLVNRLTGVGLGLDQDRMPPLGEALSDATIATIEQWIAEGCAL